MDDTGPQLASPERPLRILFLHHSIGGQLLADEGPDSPDGVTHPCGGGLRRLLEARGAMVHEAGYGSRLGEHTDLFDWLPKFRDHMDTLLRIEKQDALLPEGVVNDVVMFKSCFPNNQFVGPGSEPGRPLGRELTEANAKATLRALLPLFAARPRTLFIYLTTPPVAPVVWPESPLKGIAKKLLGKPTNREKFAAMGESAKRVQTWAGASDGLLHGYPESNVAVFDYFGILTGGNSPFLAYPTGARGDDSHPSAEGQRIAARAFVSFLRTALARHKADEAADHIQI
jgi:hypothetical protein